MTAPPPASPAWTEPPWSGWIETTGDALLILEAARRGLIPRVTRRLVDAERRMITSGSVFVFDEDESHIKRWTDGFFWSPSRILGNFLLYRQTEKRGSVHRAAADDTPDPAQTSLSRPKSEAAGLAVDRQRERILVGSLTDSEKFKPDGLMKKTFSVTIDGVAQHLISYYKIEDVENGRLRSPSSLPELAALDISPEYLDKTHFRNPPKVEIGPNGVPRYLGEADELDADPPLLPPPLAPGIPPLLTDPQAQQQKRAKRPAQYEHSPPAQAKRARRGTADSAGSAPAASPPPAPAAPSPGAPPPPPVVAPPFVPEAQAPAPYAHAPPHYGVPAFYPMQMQPYAPPPAPMWAGQGMGVYAPVGGPVVGYQAYGQQQQQQHVQQVQQQQVQQTQQQVQQQQVQQQQQAQQLQTHAPQPQQQQLSHAHRTDPSQSPAGAPVPVPPPAPAPVPAARAQPYYGYYHHPPPPMPPHAQGVGYAPYQWPVYPGYHAVHVPVPVVAPPVPQPQPQPLPMAMAMPLGTGGGQQQQQQGVGVGVGVVQQGVGAGAGGNVGGAGTGAGEEGK